VVTGNAAHLAKGQWLAAARWRRRVDRALSGSGLNFRQWLVLDATRFLIKTTHDAVSQNQVAVHLELERQALSEVMPPLERMGLVRRSPTMSGTAWRVYVTKEGVELLRRLAPSIELASEG
jgi:DNA-binding MarR family transcriptional regulator